MQIVDSNINRPLTASTLRRDNQAFDTGYWLRTLRVRKTELKIAITRDNNGRLTLAICKPLYVLGYASSLEGITRLYNEFYAQIKAHGVNIDLMNNFYINHLWNV